VVSAVRRVPISFVRPLFALFDLELFGDKPNEPTACVLLA
jgi:hypothetical protein